MIIISEPWCFIFLLPLSLRHLSISHEASERGVWDFPRGRINQTDFCFGSGSFPLSVICSVIWARSTLLAQMECRGYWSSAGRRGDGAMQMLRYQSHHQPRPQRGLQLGDSRSPALKVKDKQHPLSEEKQRGEIRSNQIMWNPSNYSNHKSHVGLTLTSKSHVDLTLTSKGGSAAKDMFGVQIEVGVKGNKADIITV